jgi:hypothetical protein
MNFYDALNAHLAWKLRLRDYIDGKQGEYLEPEHVGCDDGCELGRWIRSQYPLMRQVPEFRRVREQHADFHRCAAEVVQAVNAGDLEGAEYALQNEYAHLSALVVKSITKLNRSLSEEEKASEAA